MSESAVQIEFINAAVHKSSSILQRICVHRSVIRKTESNEFLCVCAKP
jgi:hypothetical protein